MATLNEAPKQLQEWIDGIDAEITRLTSQRGALTAALTAINWEPIEVVLPAPKPPPAKPKAAKKPAHKTNVRKYDYTEVARVANAAQRAGEPSRRAVAQRFSISVAAAGKLIQAVRAAGHEVAASKTGRPLKPAPSNVTPIARPEPSIDTANLSGVRAFTPDDTLKLLDRA